MICNNPQLMEYGGSHSRLTVMVSRQCDRPSLCELRFLEAKDKHVSDKLCIIGNVDSPVILMLTCISQTVYSQLTGIVDSALAAPTCSTSDMCSISQSRKRSLIS